MEVLVIYRNLLPSLLPQDVPGKQVTLLVVANVLLEPSRVFLLEGARIHFGARLVRKGTASGECAMPSNLVVTVDFPSEHMEVLSSTENGTHHCVRTKGPATTRITGRLEGFRTPAGAIRKAAYGIKGSQEVSIFKRIVVQPPVLLFPWDPVVKPSYSPQARVSGTACAPLQAVACDLMLWHPKVISGYLELQPPKHM
ncbi:hypothetical protein IscW_ISCW005902 [Ixodes scapularis]|uniref:NUP210 fourth Ig-like domain-containing protein n=1 Tax=Ixodes scapularis TaxID=6945 RepID=B7PR95_IXOSC|nr:hypothetical protein IscW_ISCW005902 [Ixodes scapularis]|eukprot:XP_002436287.1 hypothetical protein IscW_ISCW005902 [Ixodes scapularis]